ncbi:YcnI family protein [Gordonia alkanivorans]|uniref:YcnI family copper-binding membrane protein n=1 Tax=Gordonia alkanivorans TaxID=84096 RepID=UPI0024B7FC1F|nr:YcnI family protein [Gordonia alkanivorans]MDJ0029397.1 YcnI family protein [Gordonia alkanivorans]
MKKLVSSRATVVRRLVLPAAAAAVVGVSSLTGAGAASAHVSANAPTVTQGGYGVVNLVVPNESEVAPTTSIRVTLPGLKSARPEVMAGWKTVVTKKDDLVTELTWTAEPGSPGIPVGQFAQFSFAGGPFPEQETVELPTLQTYADGEKADWNQPTPADGTEPEKPAPMITIPVGEAGHGQHHAAPETTDAAASQTAETAQADSAARWLGGIGLVVGALGTVFGVAALMVVRRNGRRDA